MDLDVDNQSGSRFELALERFQAGDRLIIDNISLDLSPDGSLDIYVQSSWLPENVTEQTARLDMEAAEKNIILLIQQNSSLKSLIEARPWRLILVDSSKINYTEIAYLVEGRLTWATKFPA